jgi:plasmid replication initiation protein
MSEKQLIAQDNQLTSARFEYTALQRNLFYSVLKQISKNSKEKYIISVADLQNATGVKTDYSNYTEATKGIMKCIYEIHKPNGNLLQVAMFSSCEYISGEGLIEVGISEKMHPYLVDLKSNFTLFQLDVALGLSSKFSKRMYEILSQWKTFNGGIKTFELLELKTMLNLYDPKNKKESYKNWADFEKNVLKVAQRDFKKSEVNTDITFSYIPEKKGRKYHSITFKIKSKEYQKMLDFKEEKSKQWGVLVNEFKLNKKQVEAVLEQYSETELSKIIYEIRLDIKDQKVKYSIGGYCAKRFGI